MIVTKVSIDQKRPVKLPPRIRLWLAALFAALLASWLTAPTALAHSANKRIAAPLEQTNTGMTQQLYLLPAESTTIRLQTHMANLTIVDNFDGTVSVFTDALYQIKNVSEESVTLPLVIYYGVGAEEPQSIVLSAGGAHLALSPASGGGLAAQVVIPEDNRVLLKLSYRVDVSDTPLATVRYAPGVLRRWAGPTSTRIEFSAPSYIARASWTKLAPDTWTYANADSSTTAVKWLYDSIAPDEEFILQFVLPQVWSELETAKAAASAGGPASTLLVMGDQYRELAMTDAADENVREWFTAQAIAAYSDGIDRGIDTTADTLANLHMGLAAIYRAQAASPDKDTVASSAMMVDESASALAFLATDSARRSELQQWLSDGLHVLFQDARDRADWQQASDIVDQMSGLPPGTVDRALVEEGRQIVLAQQALQLLRLGEQEAAETLVGQGIDEADTSTPMELQPLFASWNLTATSRPNSIILDARALPAQGRESLAKKKLENLVSSWPVGDPESTWQISPISQTPDGHLATSLEIDLSSDARPLHHFVPNDLDLLLLASALDQLGPVEEVKTDLLQQELTKRQPMDLRYAGNQWTAMVAELDRRADELRAVDPTDDAKTRLMAEMQAANYNNTVEEWRDLAQDSWLLFQYQGDESEDQTNAWYATVMSAPTVFTMKTQAVDTNRVVGIILTLLVILACLTAVIYWLI